MPNTIKYRDHEISRPRFNEPYDYEFVHKDYDGPDDGRCGNCDTIQECKEAIDDWHEEQETPNE